MELAMPQKSQQIYQFKITLKGITPPIWRRIQVPSNYTFWDLHSAIQDSMGWLDCHLHHFIIVNPKTGKNQFIGIPDDEGTTLPGWKAKISSYFMTPKQAAGYEYDFGDGWEHKVELEDILPADPTQTYPLCLKGKRACPPEDCGGIWGYEELLEIIKNPDHDEYKERMEWLGGEFDPERFEPDAITFADPDDRLKMAKQIGMI